MGLPNLQIHIITMQQHIKSIFELILTCCPNARNKPTSDRLAFFNFFVHERPSTRSLGQFELVHAPIVESQIDEVLVRLITQLASERLFTGVRTHVRLQVRVLTQSFAAHRTFKRFLVGVHSHVVTQLAVVGEKLAANRACEWFLAGVNTFMTNEQR
jgi:hypothetical protein